MLFCCYSDEGYMRDSPNNVGGLMQLPGVRGLADVGYRVVAANRHRLPGYRRAAGAGVGYRVVAANRHRLPGGTPACAVDGASSVVPIS